MEEVGITPEEIKTIRKKMGLPQWKFAIKLGVSPDTVQRWETGKTQPLAVFQKLLRKLERQTSQEPEPKEKTKARKTKAR